MAVVVRTPTLNGPCRPDATGVLSPRTHALKGKLGWSGLTMAICTPAHHAAAHLKRAGVGGARAYADEGALRQTEHGLRVCQCIVYVPGRPGFRFLAGLSRGILWSVSGLSPSPHKYKQATPNHHPHHASTQFSHTRCHTIRPCVTSPDLQPQQSDLAEAIEHLCTELCDIEHSYVHRDDLGHILWRGRSA